MTTNMYTDSRGHQLTTSVGDAAAACAQAMDHSLERRSDSSVLIQNALDADPECAIAHAIQGLMIHGARDVSLKPKVRASLAQAMQYAAGISAREQLYIDALENVVSGQLTQAVNCFESILKQNPTDGFALGLCQAELFWLGDMQRSLAASSSVAAHWNESTPGYSEFLGIHAFDLEEAGHYKQAEDMGRNAVAINDANIWATHAVAHVLYMQGRHKDGINWIGGLQDKWQDVGQMQFHVWWHKCLFHLERGEHDAVLEGYDAWVRNSEHALSQAMPDLYIDLQNGASLLWRLEFSGVDIGDRWSEMAALVVPRLSDFSNPFTSAHFAVILAAVGDIASCDKLIAAMREYSATDHHTLCANYGKAGLPAAQAAIAHRQGDYKQVVKLLQPARHDLWMMGGSHAQQDLFFQMLVDATSKMGDHHGVTMLLNEIERIGFVEPLKMSAYKAIGQRAVG